MISFMQCEWIFFMLLFMVLDYRHGTVKVSLHAFIQIVLPVITIYQLFVFPRWIEACIKYCIYKMTWFKILYFMFCASSYWIVLFCCFSVLSRSGYLYRFKLPFESESVKTGKCEDGLKDFLQATEALQEISKVLLIRIYFDLYIGISKFVIISLRKLKISGSQ